jgi:hypothetical protein
MAGILASIGTVVTAAVGWMGEFATAVTTAGNEIILLFVGVSLVGLGIGLFQRLIRG